MAHISYAGAPPGPLRAPSGTLPGPLGAPSGAPPAGAGAAGGASDSASVVDAGGAATGPVREEQIVLEVSGAGGLGEVARRRLGALFLGAARLRRCLVCGRASA